MTLSSNARSALANRLQHAIEGDVQYDDFSRGRYATDASLYETFPAAIVLPKTQEDILAAMLIAWEAGLPIIARGGGTGRLGQAVGGGLIIDFSKYLTRLLYYDASARTCIVEPGIRLEALNEALKPERMWFPVDIPSGVQATVGGMVATDAIGSRTLFYGRMRDNIVACDAVLAHGTEISFHEIPQDFGHGNLEGEDAGLTLDLLEMAQNSEASIRAMYDVAGGHPGYNLRALLPENSPQNLAAFLTGSEGTLAVSKRIELKLAKRPTVRALGVCHFASLGEAIRAVSYIAALKPIDIELTDRRILELGVSGSQSADLEKRILRKDTRILLLVEFMEGNRVKNAKKLKDLADLMAEHGHPRAVSEFLGSSAQAAAIYAHRNGLARAHAKAAVAASLAPIEAFAVPLKLLSNSAGAVTEIFGREGMEIIWHGQVGVGAVYLRPWLKPNHDVSDVPALAREVRARLIETAGHYTAVEGYGSGLSHAFEAVRDPALTHLFEGIKRRFDPSDRLNPGKIVTSAEPVQEMLRSRATGENRLLDAALNCAGTAVCRSLDKNIMCPSFKVTHDERDSPRGRANSLRLAVSGQLGADALTSDGMAETMALCLSCKACRSECPRAVDIAQARIGVQELRVQKFGLTKFESSAAFLPHYAPRMRKWRHILNLRDFLPWTAGLSEKLTGVSAFRPWPRWSASPFSANAKNGDGGGSEILLFPDTFNNYFDPVTLRSAADVLSASGFKVNILSPPQGERPYCCGRTFLEAGLVEQARLEARRLIDAAEPFTRNGIPLVGLEPACILTIRDDLISILDENGARGLARSSFLFEEVMSNAELAKIIAPKLLSIDSDALITAHCHQHAFGTANLARKVAGLVPGINVIEAKKSCCGMGTAFGYKPENVAMSFKIGENSLFPQIRRATRDTLLIADGYACRKQINDGTGRTARHTAVLLKLSLAAKERFGRDEGQTPIDRHHPKRLSRLRRHYFK